MDLVAAHRPVAREHVLEDPREDVMRARTPVRRRRPLVEDEFLAALAAADRFVEHVALAPAREDLLFELGKGLRGIYRLIAGHEARCYEKALAIRCRAGASTKPLRWRTASVG